MRSLPRSRRNRPKVRKSAIFWPLVLLGALLLLNFVLDPGFFSLQFRDGRFYGSLVDILNRAAPVMLLSVGMTLVIATGGVDLSVGAVMAIAGSVAAGLIARPPGFPLNGVPIHAVPGIILISLAIAAVCGLFNGFLIGFARLQPIVATLILMVAGRGVAMLLTDGQIITFTNPGFAAIGSGSNLTLPNPIWISLAIVGIVSLLTRKTAFGLFTEAVGDNPSAADGVGIDSRTIKLAIYTISATCAGVAGLIAAADIKAADANNAGLYLELDAILAVAIGGTSMAGGRFSLAGSLIGAILMQAVTTTILTRGVPTEATLILKALIVVGVCLAQSPTFANRRLA
ncbi:MAG: ABC transporter permease [Chlorobia bacterium]|nr:ABC transporter permease [Fimbriimonadaceae bacterium]